jgi:hypothetical protein
MNPLIIHPLAVVTIYWIWRLFETTLKERDRRLRERVAYMVWQAADKVA